MKYLLIIFAFSVSVFADISNLMTESQFNQMFPNRSNGNCSGGQSANVYTYAALVEASSWFPEFANSGNIEDDRRELAAFLGHTSHETTGGGGSWCGGVSSPTSNCFNWGLCFIEEVGCSSGACTGYTASSSSYPASPGKTYHGRGAIQLSWNYNYGQASLELTGDKNLLLTNPDLVKTSSWAFRTALWFWMDATSSRPSPHRILNGEATGDSRANTFSGVTNAINGGIECGTSANISKQDDRVNFFKKFAGILGISAKPSSYSGSDNAYFYCTSQTNFGASPWTGQDLPTTIITGGGTQSSSTQSSAAQSSTTQSSAVVSSSQAVSSSSVAVSSSVAISSNSNNTDCVTWEEGVCIYDGTQYVCNSDRITVDNQTAYACVPELEVWCGGFSPENNAWGQWEVSGTCNEVISTSLADAYFAQTELRLEAEVLNLTQEATEVAQIQVISSVGTVFLTEEVRGNGVVPLTSLAQGVYFVRVKTLGSGELQSLKFIKR